MKTKNILITMSLILASVHLAHAQTTVRCLTPEDSNATAARPAWNKTVERADEASRTFTGQLEVNCLIEGKLAHDETRLNTLVSEILLKKLTQDGSARTEDGSEITVKRAATLIENPTSELANLRAETTASVEPLWGQGVSKVYAVQETLQKSGETNKIVLTKDVGLVNTKDELLFIARTRPESVQVISDNADDQKYEKALKKLVEESYIKNVSEKGYEFSLRLSVSAQFPASEDNFLSLVSQLKNRLRKPLKEKLQTDLLPALTERL